MAAHWNVFQALSLTVSVQIGHNLNPLHVASTHVSQLPSIWLQRLVVPAHVFQYISLHRIQLSVYSISYTAHSSLQPDITWLTASHCKLLVLAKTQNGKSCDLSINRPLVIHINYFRNCILPMHNFNIKSVVPYETLPYSTTKCIHTKLH